MATSGSATSATLATEPITAGTSKAETPPTGVRGAPQNQSEAQISASTDAPVGGPSPLALAALQIAISQVGVMEQPLGSNRGPQVDEYLRSVGVDPATGSYPWCAAFTYWCFAQAAAEAKVANHLVRTAGVLDHWNRSTARKLLSVEALAQPALVLPGMIFVMAFKGGTGHMGLVEKIDGQALTTIEGNTNKGGSREGIGVFRRTARTIRSINRGFLAY